MKELIFTKENLEELLSTDSISRKEELIDQLETRVDYIVRECFFKINRTSGWWSWEYYEGEYNDPPPFKKSLVNHSRNMLDVHVDGDGCNAGYIYDGDEWGFFDGGIPLDSLWTPNVLYAFQRGKQELQAQEAQKKADNKKRREEIKELKAQHRKSAMRKLTPEEKWACGLSKKMPKTIKA